MKEENSQTAARRKSDHIDLAFASTVDATKADGRFWYEPMLAAHPDPDGCVPVNFAGYDLKFPLWVSSMTGGTKAAKHINTNLARLCGEFGFGMGLGSCRSLLYSTERLPDFDMRDIMGNEVPLFANLGIAQVEHCLEHDEVDRIANIIDMLRADGLIVHVNPLQEWMQPEGDRFARPPVDTIRELLSKLDTMIIVKEVGQGMGPASLRELLKLPIQAIEFAAQGGTNFTQLELMRRDDELAKTGSSMTLVGHNAYEMVEMVNAITDELGDQRQCRELIISGGLKDYLDGYYLTNKVTLPAVYGHASRFLRYATNDYDALKAFTEIQTDGLRMANAFLRVR